MSLQVRKMSANHHLLEVNWACDSDEPLEPEMTRWANIALDEVVDSRVEVSLKIVSTKEMIQLNREYRGKDSVTNVLSFPSGSMGDVIAEEGRPFLGDIAICIDCVKVEASDQGKTLSEHFAHLLVHGVLHLAGFDHEDDKEAVIMEEKEIRILSTLGIKSPYENGNR